MITTENKTISEVLTEIMQAIIKQGGRCMLPESNSKCAYGDGKGKHCGVGWLLPPDNEKLMKYRSGVSDLVLSKYDLGTNSEFIEDNGSLLEQMQLFHDTCCRSGREELEPHVEKRLLDQWEDLKYE